MALRFRNGAGIYHYDGEYSEYMNHSLLYGASVYVPASGLTQTFHAICGDVRPALSKYETYLQYDATHRKFGISNHESGITLWGDTAITPGRWYHVLGFANRKFGGYEVGYEDSSLHLYVNGVLDGSVQIGYGVSYAMVGGAWSIGLRLAGGSVDYRCELTIADVWRINLPGVRLADPILHNALAREYASERQHRLPWHRFSQQLSPGAGERIRLLGVSGTAFTHGVVSAYDYYHLRWSPVELFDWGGGGIAPVFEADPIALARPCTV